MPLAKPKDPSTPVLSHFSLQNKVAAVTGGARGIGLEIVRALAEAGCAGIGFTYTTSTSAPQIAKDMSKATGCDIRAYQADVRNKQSITNAIQAIAKDFGDRLDICVANAGVAAEVDALRETEAQWRDMMGVNLDGAMWTAQAAGNIFERMKADGKGKGDASMIFTASVSAILVNVPQKQAAYNASKAAVVHLAKSLAVEWAEFARVNCISPGFIDTEMLLIHPEERRAQWMDMIPGRRLCDAAELKGAFVFLASGASSYMTGANLVIDGGYTLP